MLDHVPQLAAFPWEDLIQAVLAAIAAFLGAHRGGRAALRENGR